MCQEKEAHHYSVHRNVDKQSDREFINFFLINAFLFFTGGVGVVIGRLA